MNRDKQKDRGTHRRLDIGLCLSGGGYRSAIFHLGALRRLHELGILERVELISSVSGGSIFSAFVADRALSAGVTDATSWREWLKRMDFDAELTRPFAQLAATDLRTGPVLKHVLWNWARPSARARSLERRLDRLLSGRRIGDLPRSPHFIFCATDLTHGSNWEFRRHRAGSWRAGYLDPTEIPLARAVAASACFPPVFGPIRISAPAARFRAGRDRIAGDPVEIDLSDGGVYDNLGLEPAWKFCRTLLVSDCGAPFQHRSGGHYVGRLMRYTAVVTNQALSLRKRMLFAGFREGRLDGAYWGLHQSARDAEPGYGPDLVGDCIARVRTDLDRFSAAEFGVLCNHGYTAVERSLRAHLPDLVRPAALAWPFPQLEQTSRARAALAGSHRRFSFRRLFSQRSIQRLP